MSVEKYIHGKKDDAHHDGAFSNRKRLEQAMHDEEVGRQLEVSVMVYRQRDHLPDDIVSYHTNILRAWGLLPEDQDNPSEMTIDSEQ